MALPHVEVSQQAVEAALAAEAGFLVATERRRWVEPVERIGPHDPGAQLRDHAEDPAALLRPDPGAEAVRRVVGLLDRLGRRAERDHGQDRPEDLLLRDT